MKFHFSMILVASVFVWSGAAPAAWGAGPPFSGTKSVTSTIVINKAGTYDFGNVLHVWKGTNWPCTGDKENGPQILRIEADNVTVKNFAFVGDGKTNGSKGLGDPIHITTCGTGQGNKCSRKGPKNVVLDGVYGHACEDMITVGTPGAENITIQNSTLKANPSKSSWDKTVQVNFGRGIKILNNHFVGGERCLRLKPNTDAFVKGNKFEGCNNPIRASSNDKDIEPMTNGPVTVEIRSNDFGGKNSLNCNDKYYKGDGVYTCK